MMLHEVQRKMIETALILEVFHPLPHTSEPLDLKFQLDDH